MDVQCLTPTLAHTSLQCTSLSSAQARSLMLPSTLYLLGALLFLSLAVVRRSNLTARSMRAGLLLAISGCIAFILSILDLPGLSLRSPRATSHAVGIASTLPVLLHLVALRVLCGTLRRAPDRFLLGLGVIICTFHLLVATLEVSFDPRPRFTSTAAQVRSNGLARTELALALLYYSTVGLAFLSSLQQRRSQRSLDWPPNNDKRSSSTSARTRVPSPTKSTIERTRAMLSFGALLLFAVSAALDLSRPSNFGLQFTSSLFGSLGYFAMLAFCSLHARKSRGLFSMPDRRKSIDAAQGLSRVSTTGATRGHGRGSASIDLGRSRMPAQRHAYQAVKTTKSLGTEHSDAHRDARDVVAALSRSASEPYLRRNALPDPPSKPGSEASWISNGVGVLEARSPRSSADMYVGLAPPSPAHLAPSGDVSDHMEHMADADASQKLVRYSSSQRSSFTLHATSPKSSSPLASSAHASATSLIALRRSLANLASVFRGSPPPCEQDLEARAGHESPCPGSPVSPLELEPAVSHASPTRAHSDHQASPSAEPPSTTTFEWQGYSLGASSPATTAYDPLLAPSLHGSTRAASSIEPPRHLPAPTHVERHAVTPQTLLDVSVDISRLALDPQLLHLQELDDRLIAVAAEANLVGLGISMNAGSEEDLGIMENDDSGSTGPCTCARCRAASAANVPSSTLQPHLDSEGDGDDEASSAQHELANIVRRALQPVSTTSTAADGAAPSYSDSSESDQRTSRAWRRARRPSTPLDFPVRAGSPLLLSPVPVRKTSAPQLSTRWGHVRAGAVPHLTQPNERSSSSSDELEGQAYGPPAAGVLQAESPLARFASEIAAGELPRDSIEVKPAAAKTSDDVAEQQQPREPEEKLQSDKERNVKQRGGGVAVHCETCASMGLFHNAHTSHSHDTHRS